MMARPILRLSDRIPTPRRAVTKPKVVYGIWMRNPHLVPQHIRAGIVLDLCPANIAATGCAKFSDASILDLCGKARRAWAALLSGGGADAWQKCYVHAQIAQQLATRAGVCHGLKNDILAGLEALEIVGARIDSGIGSPVPRSSEIAYISPAIDAYCKQVAATSQSKYRKAHDAVVRKYKGAGLICE